MADTYDSFIRRAVPRYDEMIARLVDHLPAAPMQILELGCGTGNLTLRLASKYPRETITTVDAAPEMIELTVQRAAKKGTGGDRFKTNTSRFEDLSFATGSFDLVTSSMSLHHVTDKATLYRRIGGWLVPGGSLCFADMLLGATPEAQQVMWDGWIAFCRQPGNCTEEEVKSLIDHAAAHDHYVSLPDHVRMLTEAGFASVDCVWRNLMYSVVLARR